VETCPSIGELEERMRPGALSGQGFLGPNESLEAVVIGDSQTLDQLGLSHEDIARALADVLQKAVDQRKKLLHSDHTQYRRREIHIPNLYKPESVPHFSLNNLPSTDVGYWVDNKYQVFIAQYRGLQQYPWGCEYDRWSSFDFLVLNRESGEYVTGPGLIVHLIREHQFFEGKESSYRTDPIQLARVLELKSGLGSIRSKR